MNQGYRIGSFFSIHLHTPVTPGMKFFAIGTISKNFVILDWIIKEQKTSQFIKTDI